MDLAALKKALEEAIDPLNAEHMRLKESLCKHAQELGWAQVEGFLYHYLSQGVKKILESLPLYQNYEGIFVNSENGRVGFHPFMVATDLVRIAFKKNVMAAIAYFEKLTKLPFADGYIVNLLLGIDIEKSFEILPGFEIVTVDEIPSSNAKEHYLRDSSSWHFNKPHSQMIEVPKCALIRKIRIEPLITHGENEIELNKSHEIYDAFKEIALLLTIVGPSPVLTSFHWFSFEDGDLQGVNLGSVGWFNHEVVPFSFIGNMPKVGTCFSEIVSKYFALNGKIKKRITVALERLNFSLRRRNGGDASLEISIALESIFAEDYGENTYKIGLRVALLIGNDFKERERIRSVISAVYKQRSQLVHRGEYKENVTIKGCQPIKSKDLISEASVYVAKSIEKIVKLGAIPEWNEYELKK